MKVRFFVLLLFVLVATAGCVAQKFSQQNTKMFASFEDFRPGPKGGVDLVWATKEIYDVESLKAVFQKYDSLILDQTWIVVDRKSSDNLSDNQVQEISQHLANELTAHLGKRFRLVETPTSTTLRLSIALTNIETPNPILAVTSSLLPVGIGISIASKIVTGEHTNVGMARIELLISDANSNQPLIAAIDKRSGNKDLGTMIDSMDDAKDAINWWVKRLGTTLANWEKP